MHDRGCATAQLAEASFFRFPWLKARLASLGTSGFGTKPTCRSNHRMSAIRVPAQPVDATQALNLSAGFQIGGFHVAVR
jgi:hypothetical protein